VFGLLRPDAVVRFDDRQVRPGDPRHYCAEISRARALGWSPKMDWKDGVRDYVQWRQGEDL